MSLAVQLEFKNVTSEIIFNLILFCGQLFHFHFHIINQTPENTIYFFAYTFTLQPNTGKLIFTNPNFPLHFHISHSHSHESKHAHRKVLQKYELCQSYFKHFSLGWGKLWIKTWRFLSPANESLLYKVWLFSCKTFFQGASVLSLLYSCRYTLL